MDGKWTISGNPPAAFSAEDDFVVPPHSTGYTLRDIGGRYGTAEWNGKSLQLGGGKENGKSHVAVLRVITRDDGSCLRFNNVGLILGARSRFQPYYNKNPYYIAGTVTVTSELEDYPALIQQSTDAHTVELNFLNKFKSGTTAYSAIKSTTSGFTVAFSDTTEYLGTLTVTNVNEDARTTVNLASNFPGTLSICTNVTLIPASGIKIANLKYFDGAVIDIRTGTLEITGNISHSGKIRIMTNEFGNETTHPRFMELVKFPADVEIAASDFEFVTPGGDSLDCDSYGLTTDNDSGIATVTAVRYGNVELLSGDNKSYSGDYQSSMTNAANWSDSLWPTNPLVDYVAQYNLRTHDSSTDWKNPTDDFVFKGHSLSIDGSENRFVVCNRSFRCDDLILRNGAYLYKRRYSGIKEDDYHNLTVSGTITVEDGISKFYVGYYETLTLDCAMKGNGTVCLTSHSGISTEALRGKFTLAGNSPEFMGSVIVTAPYYMPPDPVNDYNRITPRFDRNYTTLSLTDKRSLGSALGSVNPKAFTIENMSQVKPADGLTMLVLDEPTRGIFIKWVGRLLANEGQTLKIASPLAVHGTLWKEGAGTLALANPAPTFGADATSETPDVDATNRMFMVSGGDVKIESCDAVNGLDVVFTNGAGHIVIDLGSADETFRSFGIRNTKSSTPFAATGDLQNVPVLLDLAEPPTAPFSHALFTVSAGCRETILSCVDLVKSESIADWPVQLSWRENDDATFTLMATVKKHGTRITIR